MENCVGQVSSLALLVVEKSNKPEKHKRGRLCYEGPVARMDAVVSLPTLDELRRHVLGALCAHDHLDPNQTPLHQAIITRAGRTCGLFFQIQGPRMLKNYAIWAGEEDRILYYDSTGVRFGQSRLLEAPDPCAAAA